MECKNIDDNIDDDDVILSFWELKTIVQWLKIYFFIKMSGDLARLIFH